MRKIVLTLSMLAVLALPAMRVSAAPDGKELYTRNCKECHGVTGDGKSPSGKALNPKVKQDLSDAAVQAKIKDEDIIKSITDGVKSDDGKVLMKPLKEKDKLSDEDIKAIVQYVRTLKK